MVFCVHERQTVVEQSWIRTRLRRNFAGGEAQGPWYLSSNFSRHYEKQLSYFDTAMTMKTALLAR